MDELPKTGFLRLWQILGNKNTPALIPVSKSSWWAGVKSGRYPKPTKKLGARITAWHVEDIIAFINAEREGNEDVR